MKPNQKKYFLFHKPYGVLSQFTREVEGHKVIGDYFDFPKDVYPVGRLDKDSEGLLLLTNDKPFIDSILNPKKEKPKTYVAQVEGAIDSIALTQLSRGVRIKLPNKKIYKTMPAKVSIYGGKIFADRIPPIRDRKTIPTSWVKITITEGKNRQIRKMCAAVGFPVLRCCR